MNQAFRQICDAVSNVIKYSYFSNGDETKKRIGWLNTIAQNIKITNKLPELLHCCIEILDFREWKDMALT